jgi:predicted alpha/beta-fold hydrolase
MPVSEIEQQRITPQMAASDAGARRRRRILRRILIAFAVLAAAALIGMYGASVYFVQQNFSHRVEKLLAVPSDLGLQGETIALTSSDGIPLKAWWVPSDPAKGAVIVLHGMDGLDASCLLPQAKFLHEAGWSTLVLDMRAHGRSGGKRIGLSLEEP